MTTCETALHLVAWFGMKLYSLSLLFSTDSNTNDVITRLLNIMLEAMVPPPSASTSQGGGGATAKEATPIPLKALNLIAMHPKIRLMEMVKVRSH